MNKKKLFSKIFLASLTLALPLTSLPLMDASVQSFAGTSSLGSYSESVTLTNSSFNNITSTSASNDVSGWKRIRANGSATMKIIDTESILSSYYLSCDNPKDASSNSEDHKILMINSALKSGQKDGFAREGYKSNSISLEANSFYHFQIAMKTESFNDSLEFGSIYLSGLKDKDGNEVKASFEKQTANEWTNYYFFVATGDEKQEVSIELWLGTQLMNSYGVAFFDEVYVTRYSENLFYDSLYENHSTLQGGVYKQNDTTKYIKIDAEEKINTAGLNFNFEKNYSAEADKLVDWTIDSSITTSSKAYAEVMNINSKSGFETKTGKTYPGSNFRYDNNQSLVLWTDEPATVSVKSNEIEIKALANYKISMLVKTNLEQGSFYVSANETEKIFSQQAFISSPELKESYSLHSGKGSAVASSTGNKFENNYQTVDFFIQGNNFYDSAVTLSLNLGDETSGALGFAVIDDITIEYVSASDYEKATDKLSFAVGNSSETITNGFFNFTDNSEDLTYPLPAKDFTIIQEDKDNMAAGIINTYEDYYDEYKTSYEWGNLANPALVQGAPVNSTKSNNMFMFWNKLNGYQSLSNTNAFSVDSNNYYELSFAFKTYSAGLTVEVINDENIVLFRDENITADGPWQTYKTYIYTGEASHSLKVVIHFGTKENKVKGYGFIDNLKLTTSSSEVFNACDKKMDLSNLLLNIDPFNEVNSNLTNHPAFKGSLENGSDGEGGVIIGNGNTSFTDQNNNPIDKDQDLKNNVLVVRVGENSTYKLKSTYTLDLEKDAYYSLKFKLLTNHLKEYSEEDDDYGALVGLSGFDKTEKIINNKGWQEYTVLFKATEAKSANIEISLSSDSEEIYGTLYVTDLIWEKVEESVFTSAENKDNFNKTLFTTQTSQESEDDKTESEDDKTETTNENFNWILIPSLITAVALILAVIGGALKKVKSGKKSVKKDKEAYDRKQTLNKNFIKTEALKIRDAEARKLENEINTLTEDLKQLEKNHKDYIEESRALNNGKITKEIEKQFKVYSSKRNKLSDKLQNAKEHLENINSPEYLIVLEKKVTSDALKLNKANKK